MAENGKVIVTGCMGAEPDEIRDRFPNVLGITGPQQYESVVAAVHEAVPPAHDPFLDLVPPQGVKLTPRHYAYLKISEGCNNRCSFCIIPKLRGDLVSRARPATCCARPRSWSRRASRSCWSSRRTPAPTASTSIRREPVAAIARSGAQLLRPLPRARRARRLGPAALRLPLPACRRGHPADGRGQGAALSRHPLPACLPAVLKAMRRPARRRRWTASALARDLPGPRRCARPSSSAFPARPRRISILLDWLKEAQLDRVGCFHYEPVQGAAANDARPPPVPEEVKEERWHRFMEAQQRSSAKRMQAQGRQRLSVIIDEAGPTRREGPLEGRCAGDRRCRLRRDPPAVAGRRHRHGQDRARRCLRPARRGGLTQGAPGVRSENIGGGILRIPASARRGEPRPDLAVSSPREAA